ncbi:MAG: type II/IV secretion system protein [Candidatus Paceibacterota bacterium]
MIEFDDEKQNKRLSELRAREQEDLAHMLSERYDIPYVDLSKMSINGDALRLVPEKIAREHNFSAFSLLGKKLGIATTQPPGDKLKEIVADLDRKGFDVSLFIASPISVMRAWDRYGDISHTVESKEGVLDIANDEIGAMINEVQTITDIVERVDKVIKEKHGYKISKVFEMIIAGALALKASDIHLEPEEDFVRLRYRLDGVLTEIVQIDNNTYRLVLSRIKLLSGLMLNVKNSAQDGRFSIKVNESEIQIRTSTLPGAYNESVVMRILDPKSIQVSIESLGIEPHLFDILMKEIERPNGLILTTGPTGSGKTTTLYSFLRKVHTPDIKILTVEDPIEYHLPGIVQTQTEKDKYTFATGLRAALRQDPDIIMVGEIRDKETAEMAINAALTGHLVFSTLHTNTAAGAFPRLIDMGINPKVIGSALSTAMAQRLVRKVYKENAEEVPITGKDKDTILAILKTIVNRPDLENIQTETMWQEKSDLESPHLAYKGRVGVYEAILMNEEIEKIVRENPSEREIRLASLKQGILTMEQDAIVKVLQGVTTLKEVRRVIDIDAVASTGVV